MRTVSREQLADLLNNSDPVQEVEAGNSWWDLQDLVFENRTLHTISWITAESCGTMLLLTRSAKRLHYEYSVPCRIASTITTATEFLNDAWLHRAALTSMLHNLLSAAKKCWSFFSTFRSLMPSMLLRLIFRTQRESCAEKLDALREKGLQTFVFPIKSYSRVRPQCEVTLYNGAFI